ncbi:MAG: SpoIIIAH-like family protein [Clostridiales bacterium]|jgi:stage III sporulation protein AH|nr:SpoIIIAH-like family protein [Clostridiales bacterium]
MFSLKRNQIIISALVIMICVAGYLNYIDSKGDKDLASDVYSMTSGGDIGAIVLDDLTGQEVAVIGQNPLDGEVLIASNPDENIAGDPSATEPEPEPGAAVFVNASTDSSFFVQAKLGREQDRSKQKETLNDVIASADVDMNTKALCAEYILDITDRMETENATESALIAKGFGESYVRLDDNWVEVIINKNRITEQELAQLEDIVTRTTGYTVDKIRLSSVKAE